MDLIHNQDIRITIGVSDQSDIRVSEKFYQDLLVNRNYSFSNYFDTKPIILLKDGSPDYISTIFYLVNGFQEYNLHVDFQDKYGRLNFKHSLQYRFDVLEKDLVKSYFEKLLFQIDPNLKIPEKKSRIFLSHDIDSIYGSLKYDGLWSLKKMRVGDMLKIIWQTALSRPPWFNMDKVAKLENAYDVKACYYWIVENGRDGMGIKNGDYNFHNSEVKRQYDLVHSYGNEMGIHKSTMPTGFAKECQKIPDAKSNRHHFLKIDNPSNYLEMEENGILSDSSIGFPYNPGFKNSFGMPYFPYDIKRGGAFKVLEIPLQIMDGMYDITDKSSAEKAYRDIEKFIDSNSKNAIISILWHNSELTEFAYRWSLDCYKKVLQYLVDNEYECVLPSQMVKEYSL